MKHCFIHFKPSVAIESNLCLRVFFFSFSYETLVKNSIISFTVHDNSYRDHTFPDRRRLLFYYSKKEEERLFYQTAPVAEFFLWIVTYSVKMEKWQRQETNRFDIKTKQQLCTCIKLFCAFPCRLCTITKWNCLISRFRRTWTQNNDTGFLFLNFHTDL